MSERSIYKSAYTEKAMKHIPYLILIISLTASADSNTSECKGLADLNDKSYVVTLEFAFAKDVIKIKDSSFVFCQKSQLTENEVRFHCSRTKDEEEIELNLRLDASGRPLTGHLIHSEGVFTNQVSLSCQGP